MYIAHRKLKTCYIIGLSYISLNLDQVAIAFLIAVTVFHEVVHYGRNMRHLPDDITIAKKKYEAGYVFETKAFNMVLTEDNYDQLDRNYEFSLK